MLGKPKTTNKNILLTVSNWILESLKKLIGEKEISLYRLILIVFTKKKKIFSVKNTKSTIGYFQIFSKKKRYN